MFFFLSCGGSNCCCESVSYLRSLITCILKNRGSLRTMYTCLNGKCVMGSTINLLAEEHSVSSSLIRAWEKISLKYASCKCVNWKKINLKCIECPSFFGFTVQKWTKVSLKYTVLYFIVFCTIHQHSFKSYFPMGFFPSSFRQQIALI